MLIFEYANKVQGHDKQWNLKANAEDEKKGQKEVEIALTGQGRCLILGADTHEEFQTHGQDEISQHGTGNE